MNISTAEVKFTKDEYDGFYSCGMTMLGSSTMRRFAQPEESDGPDAADTGDAPGSVVMKTDDGIVLTTETTLSPYSDAYEICTRITNGSDETVTMEMLTSFLFRGVKADKLHRILSFWSAEGRLLTTDLTDINMEHSWNHLAYRIEKFGNVGSMPVRKYFPFVALEDSESHTFLAVQLYSPASWQIELTVRGDDGVTLSGGIADRDFGQWTKQLKPGETFEAPKAVAAIGNSLEDVCDKLVRAQHPDISPVDDEMGIAFNEYCTTWGNPTIESLKKLADHIASKGIQYLVMDAGWYSDCGNWWEYRGDWSVNRKRFPNGLKELTDYIRERGMIPGIWFEFEVASPKSGVYDDAAHFVHKDGVPLTVGGARFWDMEDEHVREYLRANVTDRIRNDGFGYVKIDYNDTMGMGCDGPEGPGENLRRKMNATQDYLRELKREIPDLVIENCSSGGHRLEPSFMELASQASFSDAHEIASLPIIAANLHRVVKPRQSQIWAVLRASDDEARITYSICATFLGRMGLSGDVYDLSDDQWKLVDGGIAFYRQAAPIIRDGHTIYLGNDIHSYNAPTGEQMVIRQLDDLKLVVYHRFGDSMSQDEYLRDRGIDLTGYDTVARYGTADGDFSAEAMIIRRL